MSSTTTHNSLVPTSLVINGKLYTQVQSTKSPYGLAPHALRFELSSSIDDTTKSAVLKLKISATQQIRNHYATNAPDYEACLLFSVPGVINYSRGTPTTLADIDRAFKYPINQNLKDLHCLSFAAKEVQIEMSTLIPRFRTEQMEADFARLINTAKSINALANAVIEIKCIFSSADDTAISSMGRALFAKPATLAVPELSSHENGPSRRSTLGTHLTIESLSAMYKSRHQANSGSSSIPTSDMSAPTKVVSEPNSQPPDNSFSTHGTLQDKSRNMMPGFTSTFQSNSLPKLWNEDKEKMKTVCFHCYGVGHRPEECSEPKRINMWKKKNKNTNEGREKEPNPTGPVCKMCRKPGHQPWSCPTSRW